MNRSIEVPDRFYEDAVLHLAEKYEEEENIEKAIELTRCYIAENPESEKARKKKESLEKLTRQLQNKKMYKSVYELSSRLMFGYYDKKISGNGRFRWLENKLKAKKEVSSILDVGCFRGEFSIELSKRGYKMTGVDVSENNIKIANRIKKPEQIVFLQSFAEDVADLFPSKSFNAVMLFEILEHVENVGKVLDAAENVLTPGGWVFITVPIGCSEYKYHKSLENIPLINLLFRKKTSFREHVRKFDENTARELFGKKKNCQIDKIGEASFGISYQVG